MLFWDQAVKIRMAQKLDDFKPEALKNCSAQALYEQHRTDGIPFHAW